MTSILRGLLLALPVALTACSGGGDNTDGAILDLDNLPTSPTSFTLKLSCPASISPGTTLRGLTAQFTDSKQQPVEDAFINLTASTGTIAAPPGALNSSGDSTDEFGLIEFDYGISDAVPLDSVVTIKGEVTFRNAKATKTCSIKVQNSNFIITQPLAETALVVGAGNATPVQMQWTNEVGDGVAGTVRLSVTSNGVLVTPNGNVKATSVMTNANGELDGTTSVACIKKGLLTLRAEDQANATRSTTVGITCIEAPLFLDVMVSPSSVNPAPDNLRFADLTIKPVAQDNSIVKQLPLTVQLIASAGGGDALLATSIITGESGTASSRYEAGTTPGSAEVRVCVRGSNICTTRLITVKGSASSAGNTRFSLACPNPVNVGATSDIGTALVADSRGNGVSGANLTLSPGRGAVNAPPDQGSSFGGTTGSDGRLLFTYTAPTDIKVDTTIGIRGSTNVGGDNISASCSLLARADIFMLTAPTDNSEQSLGTAAATEAKLRWLNGDRVGVVGPVVISATNNAKLTTDRANTGAQQLTLNTKSSGDLESPLFFICTQPGPVEIRAVDQATFSKLASVSVQCIDPPSSLTARVTPTTLNVQPSNNRFSEATFTLFGQGGSTVKNADLVFRLVRSAGGGDRLLNSSGVTDEGGSAIVRYEAGTTPGTTTIESCFRNSNICEQISISVQP